MERQPILLIDRSDRKYYISAAKELCYGEETIKRLKEAKTETECINIMATARKNFGTSNKNIKKGDKK